MFIVLIIVFTLQSTSGYFLTFSWNLNTLIGWNLDVTNLQLWLNYFPKLIFLLGYGILLFLNRKTSMFLSISHLGIMFFLDLLASFNDLIIVWIILYIIQWAIFFANLLTSKKSPY